MNKARKINQAMRGKRVRSREEEKREGQERRLGKGGEPRESRIELREARGRRVKSRGWRALE